jgi:hypothetical protein
MCKLEHESALLADRQEARLEGLIFLVYMYKIYLKIDH